jgi:hypothetical protein
MGQVLVQDTLPDLVIASTTTITMATTYLGKQTRISVGGQQYLYSSVITINFATTGINGLDTGAIAANSLYYIYSVQTSNTPGLVASLAAPTTGPTGFTAWKEVGRCRTVFGSATLAAITNKLGGTSQNSSVTQWVSYTPTGTWTANTTYTGKWSRVGESMDLEILVTCSGAPTVASLKVDLPTGYNIDTTKLTSSSVDDNYMGDFICMDHGVMYYHGRMIYASTTRLTTLLFKSANPFVDGTSSIDATAPFTFGSADRVFIKGRSLPIAEWAGLYT